MEGPEEEHDNPMASADVQLWKLLVGGDEHFLLPTILSRVIDFRDQDTAASLFAAALKTRPTNGVLKDEQLALWLIDRLRIGVGWREDLEDLNASFSEENLRHVEILQEGISSTTLLMALLECFEPSQVSVRCALLHMAARCTLPVPVVAQAPGLLPEATATTPTPALLYIGGLAYTVPPAKQNRMVLLLSTTSVIESRRDVLLRNIFRLDDRLQARLLDSLNENMIELLINSPLVKEANTGSMQTCQLLISNGRWDHHGQLIGPLAKAASAVVLSLTCADISADGSLCDLALQQLVTNNQGRLIFVINRISSGSPSVAERRLRSELRKRQQVKDEDCFLLPENLTRTTPDLINTFQLSTKAVLKMVDHAHGKNDVLANWLDVQWHLPSLYGQEWQKFGGFAAEVRNRLDTLNLDKEKSRRDLRKQVFPFSHAAHAAAVKRNKRATALRRMAHSNAAELLEIEAQEHKDFINAANAKTHPFFLLFLSHVMSPQHMYFFERELEVWKSSGAVANLQAHLEDTKKKLDKAMEQHCNVKQLEIDIEKIYAQLDAVDWSICDFWREIRIIKGLPQKNLLSKNHMEMIRERYESIFVPMEEHDSTARSFLSVFLHGMTVDVLDGNLLSVDEDFLKDVFSPRLYQDSLSTSSDPSESYFVISMLGVQSTGKSTLLNNLFGCNMPVSAGRTTRGMNVCHVQVSLPNSSIKHIIVQDYEGLMTMDRNDSLFDKNVCLQALATSDLVLVNTSKVIDSPTQQLLQYAAFAFHELGLQKFRELKPKLAFVLRDMANADTSAMAPAKRAMERAIRNGFIETRKMSSNLVLSDVMEVPEYIALASAVHRREPFWQESLLSLRKFIFRTMTKLGKEAVQRRCFRNWVVFGVASWDCIRTNTGLLFAKTLGELRLKNQMEEALHTALKSKGTVIKSETKVKGIMDLILKSEKTFEEQDDQFTCELEAEFKRCLELVIKEFEAKAGGKETITEPLLETWEDFRNHRIEREVRRSQTQMKLQWAEKLQIKRTEVTMNAAVGALVAKVCAETMSSDKLNQVEAKNRFHDLCEPEKQKYMSFADKRYSEERIKTNINDNYQVVCAKRYNRQPNDFDDLIDMKKEDLTAFTKVDSAVDSMVVYSRGDLANLRPPRSGPGKVLDYLQNRAQGLILFDNQENFQTTKFTPDTNVHVNPRIQDRLSKAIPSLKISLVSLYDDIEAAVQEINSMIEQASHGSDSAKLRAWTSQLAKAAHRHLYRNIINRVVSLSNKAKQDHLEHFTNLVKEIERNYVAKITGKLQEDLYQQITLTLSEALLKMAVDPARLGLRVQDASKLLKSHFSAISSPEMVEEICYDNLFIRKNDELLFKYIKNRSATTTSTWTDYYKAGERSIRNSAHGKMEMIFSGPGCDFENLKTATEEWFQDNDGKKKVPIKNLWDKLGEQFEFLHSDIRLVALSISNIEEVSLSICKSSWPEAFTMISRAKVEVDKHLDELRRPIQNFSYGCSEVCPFCHTKCKHPAHHVTSHECHRHLITGFGGSCFKEDDGTRSLNSSYCTGSSFDIHWFFPSNENVRGSFYECLADYNKNNTPGWKIERESAELPPLEQREAFKRLNKKIASHFGFMETRNFW